MGVYFRIILTDETAPIFNMNFKVPDNDHTGRNVQCTSDLKNNLKKVNFSQASFRKELESISINKAAILKLEIKNIYAESG
jgi:hypothetical protein